MNDPVVLDGASLSVTELVRAARHGAPVALSPRAEAAIAAGHEAFEHHARSGACIYGMTTGVGALDSAPMEPEDNLAFQRNLLLSHAAGVGPPMEAEAVRAMLIARANVLAKGRSGVRLETVHALLALIGRDVIPYVPEIGSVGASDLAPLAHAALVLVGEGAVLDGAARVPARAALAAKGLVPVVPSGRDAFALVNGTSQTLAVGALAVHDAERLVRTAEGAAVMTMVACESRIDSLDPRLLHDAERHAGAMDSARRMGALLGGFSGAPRSAVREALSIRCAPQVFGAARAAIERAGESITIDLNAAVDNPMLLPDGSLTNNAGTMHTQSTAECLDALTTSLTSVASMSERRTARLLEPSQSGGLPAFLVHPGAKLGVNSGLMIPQYTAAAIVGELRSTSAASITSIPVSNGTEDHGSMGALAARRATRAVRLAEIVVAIEVLTAAQALDLRALAPSTRPQPPAVQALHRGVRSVVPVLENDRLMSDDIETILALLRSGGLADPLSAWGAPASS